MKKVSQARCNPEHLKLIAKISKLTGLKRAMVSTMAMESGLKALASPGSIAGQVFGHPVEVKRLNNQEI
jgi:hypothetical protein